MGLLNKLFGFRWSLYVVMNENQIAYAMHENSVLRIVGYVMGYFAKGAKPVEPWSLFLNFNHKHQTIKLRPEHFSLDGEDVTSILIHEIEAIDPGWQVKGEEPVFEEAATKKRLKISRYKLGNMDWQKYIQSKLDNPEAPTETTFYSVMDTVFGKR